MPFSENATCSVHRGVLRRNLFLALEERIVLVDYNNPTEEAKHKLRGKKINLPQSIQDWHQNPLICGGCFNKLEGGEKLLDPLWFLTFCPFVKLSEKKGSLRALILPDRSKPQFAVLGDLRYSPKGDRSYGLLGINGSFTEDIRFVIPKSNLWLPFTTERDYRRLRPTGFPASHRSPFDTQSDPEAAMNLDQEHRAPPAPMYPRLPDTRNPQPIASAGFIVEAQGRKPHTNVSDPRHFDPTGKRRSMPHVSRDGPEVPPPHGLPLGTDPSHWSSTLGGFESDRSFAPSGTPLQNEATQAISNQGSQAAKGKGRELDGNQQPMREGRSSPSGLPSQTGNPEQKDMVDTQQPIPQGCSLPSGEFPQTGSQELWGIPQSTQRGRPSPLSPAAPGSLKRPNDDELENRLDKVRKLQAQLDEMEKDQLERAARLAEEEEEHARMLAERNRKMKQREVELQERKANDRLEKLKQSERELQEREVKRKERIQREKQFPKRTTHA